MPKRLPERWQPECIREYRLSARLRYDEGLSLAAAGHRTGAIYLWGYSAEMVLKAAYFTLMGRAVSAPLTWSGDILPAINSGRILGIAWPFAGQGHNIRAWAEFLVAQRARISGAAYPPRFGRVVQRCGHTIGQLWSEALRYHKNRAYTHEVTRVGNAVEWLIVHALTL